MAKLQKQQKVIEETTIAVRRRKVASLLLQGIVTQTEIAKMIGVSNQTVSNDVEAIKHLWRQETAQEVGVYKARAIKRVEALLSAIWPKAMAGDLAAVGKCIELMAREAKIIGYDAAEKVDHQVNVKLAAQQVAEQLGLDPGDVLAEANRILEMQKVNA